MGRMVADKGDLLLKHSLHPVDIGPIAWMDLEMELLEDTI